MTGRAPCTNTCDRRNPGNEETTPGSGPGKESAGHVCVRRTGRSRNDHTISAHNNRLMERTVTAVRVGGYFAASASRLGKLYPIFSPTHARTYHSLLPLLDFEGHSRRPRGRFLLGLDKLGVLGCLANHPVEGFLDPFWYEPPGPFGSSLSHSSPHSYDKAYAKTLRHGP